MTRLLLALGLLLAPLARADERISAPPPDSPEAPILAAFRAAVANDFAAYLDTIHPDFRTTENERSGRQQYEWRRFLTQHSWYLEGSEDLSILVVYRKPDGHDVTRVFLRDRLHKERMPVPVKLKRFGTGWKITVSSL